ncbi:MAG: BatA domain-containing protein [Mariniblastus sp.]|nr:BatA domain-containing protein [Mariniblastus sp.]
MTWANLGILGLGGILLTVPIILHFLMRPKPKDIVFPAMRFLQQRSQSTSSRMRMRHVLLLLMRCLLIGLLALALAGPSVASGDFANWLILGGIGTSGILVGAILLLAFFRKNKNWILIGILGALLVGHLAWGGWAATKILTSETAQLLGDDQAPVAALIVVDTSPRMDYKQENKSRLEAAKEAGDWLISQFPGESQVCVLPTNNDRPFFSVDVAAAKRRLETLEVDFSGATIPATLLDGLEMLGKAQQERKEIYLITDLTRESWADENPRALIKQLEKDPSISLFVFDVGVEFATNFGLTQVNLSDAEISQNGTLAISAEIQRQGGAAQRTVKMSIEKPEPPRPVVRDNKSLFPETVFDGQDITKDIRENSSVPLKFTFSQPLPRGIYHGKIEIEGQDALAIDDQRYFTIRVGGVKRTLVVHPENVNPRLMEALLAPRAKVEAGTSKYENETMLQEKFVDSQALNEYDAIFLLDPEPMGDEGWRKLENYVQAGGGLGVFLGHNAADGPLADSSFQTQSAQRILTGSLEQPWFTEESDLFLSPHEYSHPIFDLIRDKETDVPWNRYPVFTHWGIEPDENSEELPTQTLLRFGNREPAVIERNIGAGRVIVMTTPVTEYGYVEDRQSWNTLTSGSMIPAYYLLRGAIPFLVQRDVASLNIRVGQSASFENDPRDYPEIYQVFSPEAKKPPSILNADKKLLYRFTDYPGHYRLKGVVNEQVLLRGFSANLDQATTDLTRIELDRLDQFLGAERYQLARQKNEIQRQQGKTRRGQEFYPLLLMMMMVVMAVEYLMSNRFYKS